ncbi:SDR family oxidoreductase [uncultured Draconibacterium sp.]|uniref:SDR family NAD(P)-dependent oxidoreductase n=1 Tax=uncultured Draconibacterium sp. TaxID=1573823 RepID=UPI002AA87D8B|nr:SDR family oxidoreductase [uncultured Draconibacterium sp.]
MKTAIVTGASSGIGKCIALQLAQLNYSLVITGRNEKNLQDVKKQIEKLGADCLVVVCDLSGEDIPLQLINKTITHFGQLDLLINNAGVASATKIAETSIDIWDQVFKINARAPFLLCKEAVPHLKKSKNPIIINIGSVVGSKGYYGQGAYAASKHALTGFTKVLAKEVQQDGIKVHLISPGGVNTEMATAMRPDIDTSDLILPEEIAELVEYLVTRKGKGTIDHFYVRRENGLAFD